jgi:valyl-tRNA synthetase
MGPDSFAKTETQAMVAFVRDQILALLHPFMPFVTEELWSVTAEGGVARESLLALAPWPLLTGLDDEAAEAEIGFLVDLIGTIRSARTEFDIPPSSLSLVRAIKLNAKSHALISKYGDEIERLARSRVDLFVSPLVISKDPDVPEEVVMEARDQEISGHAVLPFREGELLLQGIDIVRQRKKYDVEITKAQAEINRIDAKLANPNFIARAPEEVIEADREKREEAVSRRAKILEALERLKQVE